MVPLFLSHSFVGATLVRKEKQILLPPLHDQDDIPDVVVIVIFETRQPRSEEPAFGRER